MLKGSRHFLYSLYGHAGPSNFRLSTSTYPTSDFSQILSILTTQAQQRYKIPPILVPVLVLHISITLFFCLPPSIDTHTHYASRNILPPSTHTGKSLPSTRQTPCLLPSHLSQQKFHPTSKTKCHKHVLLRV